MTKANYDQLSARENEQEDDGHPNSDDTDHNYVHNPLEINGDSLNDPRCNNGEMHPITKTAIRPQQQEDNDDDEEEEEELELITITVDEAIGM